MKASRPSWRNSREGHRGWVGAGEWDLSYTVRLNNAGTFQFPATRVEAMYAPEIFGEAPNVTLEVMQ